MTRRTGGAELPLHGGRVPEWLAERMARLGRVVVEALVLEYGVDEVLRRLSHPFWFQSLGAVMGMDWHSSGITTSVIAALRRGLRPVESELGIFVCGGRGRKSRETPAQLLRHANRLGLDGHELARVSRLVAKVDNCAVQDGFQLYLHGFVLAASGAWVVIQQGMSPTRGRARRYHWASEGLESFVDAPHAAIEGAPGSGTIVNLADARSGRARDATLVLAGRGEAALRRDIRAARSSASGEPAEAALVALRQPLLQLPDHHEVRREDVVERRLRGTLAAVEAAAPSTFEDLLLTRGLGPRTLGTLAFVAEVLHGAPSRFSDPARFSLALGGKDGHPFPVPLRVYDDTLRVLRRAIEQARLGRDTALSALRRLDAEARRLEAAGAGLDFDEWVELERRRSHHLGGRTAQGPLRPPRGLERGASGRGRGRSASAGGATPRRGQQLDLLAPPGPS